MRIRLVALVLVVILAAFMVSAFSDRIVLHALARSYKIDLDYAHLSRERGGMRFQDFSVFDTVRSIGLSSREAVIGLHPVALVLSPKNVKIPFTLRDVSFVRGSRARKGSLSSIEQLVLVPFESRWTYRTIQGEIVIAQGAIILNKIFADSDSIRINLKGTISPNDLIDVEADLSFSQTALADVPSELTFILEDKSPEWKSISFSLRGNLQKPAIQLRSKSFGLRIGTE